MFYSSYFRHGVALNTQCKSESVVMPFLHLRRWCGIQFVISLFCLLSACSMPLAPNYDKAVSDALNAANTEAMTLFASVSLGVQKYDFASRADQYAQVIGKLDALAISANARPVPKNAVTDKVNAVLDKTLPITIESSDARLPSVVAIRKIAETVTKMRDTDIKQGLSTYEVIAFKQQASIYFDQAITYENFLQR